MSNQVDDDIRAGLLLDEDDNNGEAVGQGDEYQGMSAEDRAVYELLDNDPETRTAVAAEIKRRLFQTGVARNAAVPEGFQGSGVMPHDEELAGIAREIDEAESWLDGFYQTPDAQKDYAQYQQHTDKIRRLQRKESQLQSEKAQAVSNLSQANNWVDNWINEFKRSEQQRYGRSQVDGYADSIRQMAKTLDPAIRADRARLEQVLTHLVEPNAYKQHNLSRRGGAQGRQDFRRDAGGSYTEPGDEQQDARREQQQNPYADASAEELEFLRGVGLVKDRKPAGGNPDRLVPTQDGRGYVIPVGRGRRNQRSE